MGGDGLGSCLLCLPSSGKGYLLRCRRGALKGQVEWVLIWPVKDWTRHMLDDLAHYAHGQADLSGTHCSLLSNANTLKNN